MVPEQAPPPSGATASRDLKDVLAASCLHLGFAALLVWEIRAFWVDLNAATYRESGLLVVIALGIMAGMGLLALANLIAGVTGIFRRRTFLVAQIVCWLNVALAAVVLPFFPSGGMLAASGIAVGFVGGGLIFFNERRPDVPPSPPVTWILRGFMLAGALMVVGGTSLHRQQLREEAMRKAELEEAERLRQRWAAFEKILAEAVRDDRPEEERRKGWEAIRHQNLRLRANVLEVDGVEGGRVRIRWESVESYAVDLSVRPPGRKKLSGTAEGETSRIPAVRKGGGAMVVIRPGAAVGTLDLRGSIE